MEVRTRMANITPYTNQIRAARYGEEVRGSIVNALEAMNSDITDDTNSARVYAENAAGSAEEASETATGLTNTLAQIESDLSAFESAEQQRDSAESARVSAETARAAAERVREDTESGYVAQARGYAAQAQQYASSDNAILSRSWAVGGTSTRYGEDTNNAKYWAEQAAYIVTEGGVATFNGRTGAVVPESGDYTASQITRGTGTVETALTSIESAVNTLNNTTLPAMQDDINEKVSMTDALLNLDTTQAATTVDGALYAAIVALGWESEVITSA